jgi:hypothetical protein
VAQVILARGEPAPPTPPRRFLCARCRSPVLICSHCDRGQRYCSAACSLQARSCAQRAAAASGMRHIGSGDAARVKPSAAARQKADFPRCIFAWANDRSMPVPGNAAAERGGQLSLHHRHWLSVPDRLLGVEMLRSSTRRPAVRPAPDRMTAIGGGSEVEVPAGNRRGQTGKQPFTPFITRVYGLVSLEGLKDPLE